MSLWKGKEVVKECIFWKSVSSEKQLLCKIAAPKNDSPEKKPDSSEKVILVKK